MNKVITIVSGLPRSGTSMMMKMLEAGGMEVMVDNIRKADEDNPKGYYEFEKVKKIKEDSSWLDTINGKAVKMVSMLLYDLPADREYKIVFMERNMEEALASQKVMLERRGADKGPDDEKISVLLNMHLKEVKKWLGEQKHIKVLYVKYNDAIERPGESSQIVNEFMDNELNVDGMIKVVDKTLYKQRK